MNALSANSYMETIASRDPLAISGIVFLKGPTPLDLLVADYTNYLSAVCEKPLTTAYHPNPCHFDAVGVSVPKSKNNAIYLLSDQQLVYATVQGSGPSSLWATFTMRHDLVPDALNYLHTFVNSRFSFHGPRTTTTYLDAKAIQRELAHLQVS